MSATSDGKSPHLTFQVGRGLFAMSAVHIREIMALPPVVPLPNLPPEIRGVIQVRGSVLKLIDLRIRLGIANTNSDLDGLVQLLHDREQDHRKWLQELENCVREHRPFGLARDPHKCKFGQWYDRYENKEVSIQASFLRIALKSMEEPHQIIHASADEVLREAEAGNHERALAILAERRESELATMIRLFAESRRVLQQTRREIVIIVKNDSGRFGICVDGVQSLERIAPDCIENPPEALAGLGGLNCRVVKRADAPEPVLLLTPDQLLPHHASN